MTNNNTAQKTSESSIGIPVVAHKENLVPERKHYDDAGADLRSAETLHLVPGEYSVVKTGVHIKLPENTVGYITPRSGLASRHGITVLNAPGTIDASYTGEIAVVLMNFGNEEYTVNEGDRIAQLVVQPVLFPSFTVVDTEEELIATTTHREGGTRGSNGFGSTGR